MGYKDFASLWLLLRSLIRIDDTMLLATLAPCGAALVPLGRLGAQGAAITTCEERLRDL